MIGSPKVPFMLHPFAYDADSRAARIPTFSSDFRKISYFKGMPVSYSVPEEGGGVVFTRKTMNRLAYDATVGKFKSQFGFVETFNPDICKNIEGYPIGAILKWFKFVRLDGGAMPIAAADKLMAETSEFNATAIEALQSYRIGDVGTIVGKPAVVVAEYDREAEIDDIYKMTSFIELVGAYDVKSVIEGNTNDFRATGPTDGNGWELIYTLSEGFFPAYNELADRSSELMSRSTARTITTDEVEIPHDGWLVVKCTRELEGDGFTTLGQLVEAYSDGFFGNVTSPQASNTVLSVDRQFGSLSQISEIVPVESGSRVSFIVRNNSGSQLDFSCSLVGLE